MRHILNDLKPNDDEWSTH